MDFKNPFLNRAAALLFPPDGGDDRALDRSAYERFAIPFTFKPRLSLAEALVAVFGALLRIFLGCLLFAVWGSYTLFAWSTIPNLLLRVAVVVPMFLLFLFAMALLLLTIAVMMRAMTSRPQSLGK